jgi:hypothetical protein
VAREVERGRHVDRSPPATMKILESLRSGRGAAFAFAFAGGAWTLRVCGYRRCKWSSRSLEREGMTEAEADENWPPGSRQPADMVLEKEEATNNRWLAADKYRAFWHSPGVIFPTSYAREVHEDMEGLVESRFGESATQSASDRGRRGRSIDRCMHRSTARLAALLGYA